VTDVAKKSKIAKDQQRRQVVARYAQRRAELKETLRSPQSTPDQRAAAALALHRLPRDASPTRLRNRDAVDGRPRGYFRAFGLSRIRLREMAHRGELPGVNKSSW
jgi:small subunit ribosomal protein S14